MNAEERKRWTKGQIAALIEIGDSPEFARKIVMGVLARTPMGEDPGTYKPPPSVTEDDWVITDDDIADAAEVALHPDHE